MTENNVVIFARSNHDSHDIRQQVDDLRDYATQHGYRIVGTVGMPFTSANDPRVEQAVAGLLTSRSEGPQAKALLVTDLSRLTRNIHRWPVLQRRIAEAGWKIVIADRSGGGGLVELDPKLHVGVKEIAPVYGKDNSADVPRRHPSYVPRRRAGVSDGVECVRDRASGPDCQQGEGE